MKRTTTPVGIPFEPTFNYNIDARCMVQDRSELKDSEPILGVFVYVIAENQFYTYDPTENHWRIFKPGSAGSDDEIIDFGTY